MRRLMVLFLLVCLPSACAVPARPGAPAAQGGTDETQSQSAFRGFGFRVVPADSRGEDPKAPGQDSQALKLDWVTNGTEYSLVQTVMLDRYPEASVRGIRPVFLVWNPEANGFRILNAFYRVERQDSANRLDPEYEAPHASQDALGRWFIPLLNPELGRTEDLDGQVTYRVSLDLQSDTGKQLKVHLYLRLVAPLPEIQARQLTQAAFAPLAAQIRVQGGGLALAAEDYVNPTHRKLVLWISSRGILRHIQEVQARLHADPGHNGHVAEYLSQYESETALSADSVLVFRSSAEPELKKIGSTPLRLMLGPGEAIRLAWIARPLSPVCPLAADAGRQFPYEIDHPPHCHGPRGGKFSTFADCDGGWTEHRMTSAVDTWRLTAAETSGEWVRSAMLSAPDQELDSLRSSPRFLIQESNSLEAHPLGSGLTRLPCQGFIRPAS